MGTEMNALGVDKTMNPSKSLTALSVLLLLTGFYLPSDGINYT